MIILCLTLNTIDIALIFDYVFPALLRDWRLAWRSRQDNTGSELTIVIRSSCCVNNNSNGLNTSILLFWACELFVHIHANPFHVLIDFTRQAFRDILHLEMVLSYILFTTLHNRCLGEKLWKFDKENYSKTMVKKSFKKLHYDQTL